MKFKTQWSLTALLAVLAAIFAGLGYWQLQRAELKATEQEQFDTAVTVTRLQDELPDWTTANLFGQLDAHRHLLLENKLYQGRAGVHVLTPLTLRDGSALLVNRGWLPLPPDRSALPEFSTPTNPLELAGRLGPLSQPGVQIGTPQTLQQNDWPQLIVYPDWGRMESALNLKLHRQVLYLDVASEAGFKDRNWTPFTMGPDRHRAYAVQWFAFALTALITWLVLGINAGRRSAK